MTIQLNPSQPNINPSKFAQKAQNLKIKAHHFAQRQVRHAFIQGSAICALEANSPSPNWQAALIRKATIDIGEALSIWVNKNTPFLSTSSKKLTTKYQATNSLAIISDLTKATIKGGKKLLKKLKA